MSDLNHEFHSISIQFSKKIVRVNLDYNLENYLKSSEYGAMELAEYILSYYEKKFKTPLKIRIHSLAIEILMHVFADKISCEVNTLSEHISKEILHPVIQAMETIHQHTSVIDCGEKDVDNNRFVWDALEPFHQIIYNIIK